MTLLSLLERYKPLRAPDDGAGASSQTIVGESPPPADNSGGGGASTTTTPPSTPSGAEAPAGEGLDFESIFEPQPTRTGGGREAPPPKAPPAPPTAPPAAAQPTTPPPTPAEGAAQAASVGTEPPQVPQVEAPAGQGARATDQPPQQPEGAAALDPYDPIALAQHLSANRAQAIEHSAAQMFQLSQEEREAIEQDVIGTLPKLMARVYVESQQGVLNQLGRIIPTMVERHTASVRKNMENESKFFSRWKDLGLDPVKHGDLARKYGAVYRQMHPQATLEQMIEDLGPMVMMAAKVIPSVGAPGANGTAGAGRAATPPTARNARGSQPFTPAGGGPASAQSQPQKEAWETIFEWPQQ